MKLIAPDYYENFTCIADKCKHSCCVGWEIDIDEETLRYYQTVGGAFGERLRAGIEIGEDCACFRLGEDERCPFLNESGLCDIILNLGEESLSQICTDHPRFCSFYGDRTEIGLGLCCEEAGRRLLSQKDKINLVVLRDDGEEDLASEEETAFFMKRDRLFEMAQDRRLSVFARMRKILREFDVAFPRKSFDEWIELLRSLEIMDSAWACLLSEAKEASVSDRMESEWEQLLWYFIYRHVSEPERDIGKGIFFAVFSVYVIRSLFAYLSERDGEVGTEALVELCRLYSSEIEYSEENTRRIMELV
jgi:lysine-N-methylase